MSLYLRYSRQLLLWITTCAAIYVLLACYFHFSRHNAGIGNFGTFVATRFILKDNATLASRATPAMASHPPGLHEDVNPYPFGYVLNKPDLCATGSKILVLIAVMTASGNFNQRRAIRDTWGKESLHRGFKLVFLLGLPRYDVLQRSILAEDSLHADIVQGNFTDCYRNLTFKSVMMVRWASASCPGAEFVLKIDDDVLLNVWDFAPTLSALHGVDRTIWGLLAQRWTPERNPRSKWYVSWGMYQNATYPDFLTGPSYLLSGDSVPLLARASDSVPYLYLEDVFLTGLVAEKAGVRRVHNDGFLNYRKFFTPCTTPRVIASHGYTPLYLRHVWASTKTKAATRRCQKRNSPETTTTTTEFRGMTTS
ncbi:beta-1,3-galactosyltransferase 5 [Ixodes scapularis]